MTTYQDVVIANGPRLAWALSEVAGPTFAPYVGVTNLTASGSYTPNVAGPGTVLRAVQLGVGGALRFTFPITVNPPAAWSVWLKLSNLTPASNQALFYFGRSGLNGRGWYMATNGQIHVETPGGADLNTGVVVPDLNWHHYHFQNDQATTPSLTLVIDGAIAWRATGPASTSPSPNVVGYGADGQSINATQQIYIGAPSYYAYLPSVTSVYAEYLGATNPPVALGYSQAGGGVIGANVQATVDAILAAVRKTY